MALPWIVCSSVRSFSLTFFTSHKPARSAFGATGLALNARTEIECAATVP
jgi:enamine deaminase RidA (YjgF/YER057c/UK114 family)